MVKLTTIKADLFIGNKTYTKGSHVEVSDDFARILCERQAAIPFVETAAANHAVETAANAHAGAKGGKKAEA